MSFLAGKVVKDFNFRFQSAAVFVEKLSESVGRMCVCQNLNLVCQNMWF
jgi:hypothetical protein